MFGWGWTPASWEGWLVLIVYLVLLFFIMRNVDETTPPTNEALFNHLLPVAVLTLILLYICFKTGEKPEWRWGKKK